MKIGIEMEDEKDDQQLFKELLNLNNVKQLKCIGCNKTPDKIKEYIDLYESESEIYSSPVDYVWKEEGTLNKETGYFACTECYVKMGMPVGVAIEEWKNFK